MQNSSRQKSTLWFIVALAGCGIALVTLLALILAFVLPETFLGTYTSVLIGVSLVAFMLGVGLLVAGLRGWRGKPAVRITTRWGWLIPLLGMFILGGAALMLPGEALSAPGFAPIHFGMVVLPIFAGLLIVIQLTGKQVVPTFRQVIVAISGGASSVLVALPVEIVGFILAGVLILMGASIFPAGKAEVDKLVSIIQLWPEALTEDMEMLLTIATSPVAIIFILVILAAITPLVEEFVKTLVMGVMGIWVRPGMGQAFIWGLSCGLGFAMVEGITNSAIGMGNAGWWLGSVFARMMASMMHALTSGLLGLGWGSLWERKWWRLPVFYFIAVVFHGLWNACVVLLVVGGIVSSTQLAPGLLMALLGGGGLLGCVSLTVAALLAVPVMLRRRREARSM